MGDGVRIGANCVIANATIAAGAVIHPFTHIDGEKAGVRSGEGALVGPFARLRPGAVLGREVHIGNFVEVKNSTLADGAKANHLAYLGDATVGERVNYGAGSITANYDGANKHRTVIEADVHIGSNCVLVAPVTIGAGGTVGGGSTITKNTPPGALSVARGKQVSIANWSRPVKKNQHHAGLEAKVHCVTQCYSFGVKFGKPGRSLDAEKGLDVAHVGVAGEQALRQGLVGRHVGHVHDQHEVRPWRDAVALLHRRVGDALLEGVQLLGALAVERNLHHRAQAVPQNGREAVGVQDRDLALDQPGIPQPLDAPQAGGRRHMHPCRQGQVAEAGVGLQGVQQPKIGFVDVD
jgi:acetyltransferase-like isoleucine patch superfamily enzyme